MKHHSYKVLFALWPITLLLSGCATTTQPNISAIYQIPSLRTQLPPPTEKQQLSVSRNLPAEGEVLFRQLYELDPVLALEVGKLPEFQKEIGPKQIVALTRIVDLTVHATDQDKANLGKFLKIGLPAVRRYSATLQAIFWILEREDYDSENNPLKCDSPNFNRCLSNLLRNAWKFKEKDRWNDYETVTDRLNAPELVDYYELKKFVYVFRNDHNSYPTILFKYNEGQCADVTAFTVYCLSKGGYKAYDYHVTSPSGLRYHHVTKFEMDGREYIMDNGRSDKYGIVPFSQYK
jgi:hypothetical protein